MTMKRKKRKTGAVNMATTIATKKRRKRKRKRKMKRANTAHITITSRRRRLAVATENHRGMLSKLRPPQGA